VLYLTTDALPDAVPPMIDAIVVTGSDSSAIISWTTDELAGSFVDLGTVSGLLDQTVGDATDGLEHEVTLTNLLPGTEYFLTVGSSDRAGNGPTESAEVSFTTLTTADVTPSAAPASLEGISGSQSITLAWDASVEADLAGYNVYRRGSGDDSFVALATNLTLPQYTDLSVQNETEYEYQITAVDRANPANESPASAALALTPTLTAAPTVPTDLRVDGEDLQPTFNFTNAEPFLTGASLSYTIQVSTQPEFSDVTDSESGIAAGVGATAWTITRALANESTYFWRVRAVEGALLGAFSPSQEFTASTGPLLAGDFGDSGSVDFDDFFAFVDAFGGTADDFPDFDLNDSGPGMAIDFDDFFASVDGRSTTGRRIGAGPPSCRLRPGWCLDAVTGHRALAGAGTGRCAGLRHDPDVGPRGAVLCGRSACANSRRGWALSRVPTAP
jgi:hypothetical protein